MHKTVKKIDSTVLIIYYQPDKEEEEITQKNESGVRVKAKDVLIDYSEAIPNYLWQIQRYFSNRRPNGKHLFSKFQLTHNIEVGDIILTLKEALEEYKFFSKL